MPVISTKNYELRALPVSLRGMSAARTPVVGDLLALAQGPMYRVLKVAAADEAGVFLLDGYEIHATTHGPELRPRRIRWPEPDSIFLDHPAGADANSTS